MDVTASVRLRDHVRAYVIHPSKMGPAQVWAWAARHQHEQNRAQAEPDQILILIYFVMLPQKKLGFFLGLREYSPTNAQVLLLKYLVLFLF